MSTAHNPYAPHRPVAPEKPQNGSEPVEPVEPTVDPEAVPEGPAAEVLRWVGNDPERAQKALEAEEAGQKRVGLTKKLQELV